MKPFSPTEEALIYTGRDMAALNECNPHWWHALVRMIDETGKKVDELTVGELRHLIAECDRIYNEFYREYGV